MFEIYQQYPLLGICTFCRELTEELQYSYLIVKMRKHASSECSFITQNSFLILSYLQLTVQKNRFLIYFCAVVILTRNCEQVWLGVEKCSFVTVVLLPYIPIHIMCTYVWLYQKYVLCFYAEAIAYRRSILVSICYYIIFSLLMSKHWVTCRQSCMKT